MQGIVKKKLKKKMKKILFCIPTDFRDIFFKNMFRFLSKAFLLFQFLFVCASVVSYIAFVLSVTSKAFASKDITINLKLLLFRSIN